MAASRAFRRLPIKLFSAKFRHHISNFDRGACGLGPAVDLTSKATVARVSFVVEAEDGIDDWHAMTDRDTLQRVGDGAAQILRVVRLSFQNNTTGDQCVRYSLRRQLTHNNWNFERPRHSLDGNRRVWRKDMQFLFGMVDQPLHISRIKLTGHDDERAFPVNNNGPRRNSLRHLGMTKHE